jgi:hypothetical protein
MILSCAFLNTLCVCERERYYDDDDRTVFGSTSPQLLYTILCYAIRYAMLYTTVRSQAMPSLSNSVFVTKLSKIGSQPGHFAQTCQLPLPVACPAPYKRKHPIFIFIFFYSHSIHISPSSGPSRICPMC